MTEPSEVGNFRIALDLDARRVEVEGPEREFVEEHFDRLIGRFGPGESDDLPAPSDAAARRFSPDAPPLSLMEHVRTVRPDSGTEWVVAVGSYLELQPEFQSGFRTRDIANGFREARFRHSNPSEAIRQARKAGWLMQGEGRSTFRLTQSALRWVQERARAPDL